MNRLMAVLLGLGIALFLFGAGIDDYYAGRIASIAGHQELRKLEEHLHQLGCVEKNTKVCPARTELETLRKEKNFAVLEKLAKENSQEAQIQLGRLYGDLKQPEEAIKWYTRAADQGNIEAINILVHLFQYGPRNRHSQPEAALKWNKRGAELGAPNLQANYARALMKGIATEKSENDAEMWFLRAAQRKSEQAYLGLAELYLNPGSALYDPAKSYAFYDRYIDRLYEIDDSMGAMEERKIRNVQKSIAEKMSKGDLVRAKGLSRALEDWEPRW